MTPTTILKKPSKVSILLMDTNHNLLVCLKYLFLYTKGIDYEIIILSPKNNIDSLVSELLHKNKSHKVTMRPFSEENSVVEINNVLKETESSYVVLLNTSVVVTKNWLRNLMKCMEKEENVAYVGSLSNVGIEGQKFDTPIKELDTIFSIAEKNNILDESKWYECIVMAPAVSLIKCELLKIIGYLDTQFSDEYLIYDICLRAYHKGYKNIMCFDSLVYVDEVEHIPTNYFQNSKKETNASKFQKKYDGIKVDELNHTEFRNFNILQKVVQDINEITVLGINVTCGIPVHHFEHINAHKITYICHRFSNNICDFNKISCTCQNLNHEQSFFEALINNQLKVEYGKILNAKNVCAYLYDYIMLEDYINRCKNVDDLIRIFSSVLKQDGRLYLKYDNTVPYEYMNKWFGIGTGRVRNRNETFEITPKYDLTDILWILKKYNLRIFNMKEGKQIEISPLKKNIEKYISDDEFIASMMDKVLYSEYVLEIGFK